MEQQYINTLIIDNIKYRYTLELQYVETDEEKQEINKILSRYDKSTEKKIDEFNNKMEQIELLTMKKLFYRLKDSQKINRLNLYFKNKYNLSDEESEKNSNNIIELLKTDILKNKDINYDIENIKIIDIKNIDFDTETKLIKFIKTQRPIKKEKSTKAKSIKPSKSDDDIDVDVDVDVDGDIDVDVDVDVDGDSITEYDLDKSEKPKKIKNNIKK
jgi:hypothetical protein